MSALKSARHIRYRFNETEIAQLLSKWWEWSERRIKSRRNVVDVLFKIDGGLYRYWKALK
ncbi:hypothetical protein O9929_27255 [Vibrio lentus]|nr:hypothetical protein [Vibrio lentus]